MKVGNSVPPTSYLHNLRQRQRDILVDLIKMANPHSHNKRNGTQSQEMGNDCWKLLIHDTKGRNIIAPLIKVRELREMGVTLYLNMMKERHAVPNSPAIYLCEPTEENVNRIVRDCEAQLYEWSYINFTSQCPRHLLELLAEQLAASGTLSSIGHIRVFDQYLSYVAETDDLYSLMMPLSFATLNSRHTPDEAMEQHVDQIALGISHVLTSLQISPIVAYSKNGPSEMIASKVVGLLSDLSRDGIIDAVNGNNPILGRSLLLIVDRNSDLVSALHHPFSYRGLLVDALGMQLNKVSVPNKGTSAINANTHKKTFDLDPIADTVYRKFGGKEFGEFSTNLQDSLEAYQREYTALTKSGGTDGRDINVNDEQAITEMLANAPKLKDQKAMLDAHMTLAHTVLDRIKNEHLDKFHGVEEALIQMEGLDKNTFEELMTSDAPMTHKQRLYLVAYLQCVDNDEKAMEVINRFIYCVSGDEKPFPALTYLKKLRSWSVGGKQKNSTNNNSSATTNSAATAWGMAQSLAKNLASTFSSSLKQELPLTRLVEALCGDSTSSSTTGSSNHGTNIGGSGNNVRSKLLEGIGAQNPHNTHNPHISNVQNLGNFSQVVIFVTGGGCVAEYDNLKIWESQQRMKSIIYGSTDLVSGDSVLEQLGKLGEE
eukprot:Tbor_TRINITY_DN5328_c2_g1::TRINITY_DN5328_c2_g1_i2::g.3816::m.3816/K19998/SCFD1, SLY1; sec1 family domain-containing protein 1